MLIREERTLFTQALGNMVMYVVLFELSVINNIVKSSLQY